MAVSDPPTFFSYGRERPVGPGTAPRAAATVGMWVFLGSLAMLFFAGMLAYVVLRVTGSLNPQLGAVTLPRALWASTAVVLAASFAVHRALRAAQRERQAGLRVWIVATLLLGTLFCALQYRPLRGLWDTHRANVARLQADTLAAGDMTRLVRNRTNERALADPATGARTSATTAVYGLILVLIVVHALHVAGGLAHLGFVTAQAFAGRFDHEYHAPVKHAAMYWHFLDVVWLVMFGTMLALG